MQIRVTLKRSKDGNRHSTLVIEDQYVIDKKDDMTIRNCGTELYAAWKETVDQLVNDMPNFQHVARGEAR